MTESLKRQLLRAKGNRPAAVRLMSSASKAKKTEANNGQVTSDKKSPFAAIALTLTGAGIGAILAAPLLSMANATLGSMASASLQAAAAAKLAALNSWALQGAAHAAGQKIVLSSVAAKGGAVIKLAAITNAFIAHPVAVAVAGAVVGAAIVAASYYGFKLAKRLITHHKEKRAANPAVAETNAQRRPSFFSCKFATGFAYAAAVVALWASPLNMQNSEPATKSSITIGKLQVVEAPTPVQDVATSNEGSKLSDPWLRPVGQCLQGFIDEKPVEPFVSLTAKGKKTPVVPASLAKLVSKEMFATLSPETQHAVLYAKADAASKLQVYKKLYTEMKGKNASAAKYKILCKASELSYRAGFLSADKPMSATKNLAIDLVKERAIAEFKIFKSKKNADNLTLAMNYAALHAYMTKDTKAGTDKGVKGILAFCQQSNPEQLANALNRAANVVEVNPTDSTQWGQEYRSGPTRVRYIFPSAGLPVIRITGNPTASL